MMGDYGELRRGNRAEGGMKTEEKGLKKKWRLKRWRRLGDGRGDNREEMLD